MQLIMVYRFKWAWLSLFNATANKHNEPERKYLQILTDRDNFCSQQKTSKKEFLNKNSSLIRFLITMLLVWLVSDTHNTLTICIVLSEKGGMLNDQEPSFLRLFLRVLALNVWDTFAKKKTK